MRNPLQTTQDSNWVLSHEGYNALSESAVESRLAFGNGFLGMWAGARRGCCGWDVSDDKTRVSALDEAESGGNDGKGVV